MLKNKKKSPPIIAAGIAILNDFDSTTKTAIPAKKQKIAVLVPEANMLFNTSKLTTMKKIFSFLTLDVIPKTRKATAAAAALHP